MKRFNPLIIKGIAAALSAEPCKADPIRAVAAIIDGSKDTYQILKRKIEEVRGDYRKLEEMAKNEDEDEVRSILESVMRIMIVKFINDNAFLLDESKAG